MSSIRYYIEAAPDGASRVLQALSVAESLTDDIAQEIYELDPIEGLPAELFVRALHYSDFVSHRNSEWCLTPAARQEIQTMDVVNRDLLSSAHELLIRIAQEGDLSLAGTSLPSYLFTNAGMAYHRAELGNIEEAISLYSKASEGPLNGAQWLASKLVEEQESHGVLPKNRVETTFLRAWVYLREGDRAKAEPLLRRVIESELECREVAIATHIVGNWDRSQNPRVAERLLRRSLDIGERIELRQHVAHVAHSLANLVGIRNRDEAEALFNRSIRIDESLENHAGIAQTLHSLANMIGRDRKRGDEAEELYRRSIEIGEEIGNQHHVAQTLHSLANIIGRDQRRGDEAEELYRRSIEIGEEIGNQHHVAQTQHSLANMIGRDRKRGDEAEELYRRSIQIEESLGDRHGVAQTQHSLANIIRRDRRRHEEAEKLLKESLKVGEELKNLGHQAQVLRSLSFVVEHRSPSEAKVLLERSLELNQRARNRRGEDLVRESLQQLRERYGL